MHPDGNWDKSIVVDDVVGGDAGVGAVKEDVAVFGVASCLVDCAACAPIFGNNFDFDDAFCRISIFPSKIFQIWDRNWSSAFVWSSGLYKSTRPTNDGALLLLLLLLVVEAIGRVIP